MLTVQNVKFEMSEYSNMTIIPYSTMFISLLILQSSYYSNIDGIIHDSILFINYVGIRCMYLLPIMNYNVMNPSGI